MSQESTATERFDERFENHRPQLFGLAYRMLASRAEAEDVVQDAYLRWHEADNESVENPEAWLVRVTGRLAIDRLRSLRRERELYTGCWLPEPLVGPEPPPPDRRLERANDLSLAFLALLERLAPEERAAFLLREVFDRGYDEIASVLDKSEAACRQIVHRARRRVRRKERRFPADPAAHRRLVERFQVALAARDGEALEALLAPDVTSTADGGGKIAASPRVLEGAPRIVKLILGLERKVYRRGVERELVSVNGETGLLLRLDGRVASITAFETDGERILAMYTVLNPDKLPAEVR